MAAPHTTTTPPSMRNRIAARQLRWVLLCGLSVCSATGAFAQTVFRCGNSYSQSPCPDAAEIAVDDSRSAQQKAQADQTTKRTAAAADALEKSRLKREQIQAAEKKAALREQALQAAKADKKLRAEQAREKARLLAEKRAMSRGLPVKKHH